jgi:hypothetical protein
MANPSITTQYTSDGEILYELPALYEISKEKRGGVD